MSTFVLYDQWKRGDLRRAGCGKPGNPVFCGDICRMRVMAIRDKKRKEKLREQK